MLPSPRLFRSRWAALFWAAGICWTAIDIANDNSAPAPAGNNAASADDDGDIAQGAAALNGIF